MSLVARMGRDSVGAAIIYQHEARGADATITNAIDTHLESEQTHVDDSAAPPEGVAPLG